MSLTDYAKPALPRGVASGVMARFRSSKVRIPDQFDPDTGLPMYRTIELVDLHVPGDQKSVPTKKVNDAIRAEYAVEYQAWKKSGDADGFTGVGLPLTHWPQLPREIAAGLAHANVFTVEQLANLSDTQCQIRGSLGIRKFRDMALAFVDASKAAAPIAAMASENELLRQRVLLVESQLNQMPSLAAQNAEAFASRSAETMPDLSNPRPTPPLVGSSKKKG